MQDRRESSRREDDVSTRVSLEKLRLPLPIVVAIASTCIGIVLSYGAATNTMREEGRMAHDATNTRVTVLEEQKRGIDKQLEGLLYEMRKTNEKLDELIRMGVISERRSR